MAVGLPWAAATRNGQPPPSSTLSPTAPYCCPHPITPQGTSTATQRALGALQTKGNQVTFT